MPIRFQVDGDFYDHPKVIGMSDAAFKLWVRAGSFSAAKLTDGFVSEDVLAETLRADKAVAEELVRRRLWRRVKGGYQFHAWGERNLTKQRVQDDQKADRERKRARRQAEQEEARKAAGQNEKPQPGPQNVRTESKRNPGGFRTESERIPDGSVSVSVSVSESVSESGHDSRPPQKSGPPGPEPPQKCFAHLNNPDPPPCGACKDARRQHDHWQRERISLEALARSQAARQRADGNRAAIDNCQLCDHTGYRDGQLCTHDPQATDRAKRGAAQARANIRKAA